MSKLVFILLALAAVLGCVPAFAVDGVILINQSSVLAAGGFPFNILQHGSYKLSSDLVVPAETNGIQISASGVTLDLNGFSIRGPILCQGTVCSPHNNDTRAIFFVSDRTTIRNGYINGVSTGILGELGGGTIEDMHITATDSFGIITINTSVRHSEVFGTAGLGLACSQCAVLENMIFENAKGGVNLGGGIFGGNVVSSNGDNNLFANAFVAQTVVSQHNNSCNDTVC